MKDFKNMNFDIINFSVNATPDIFINRNTITFTKKVLEDLGYAANVQYCISAETKVFAIRVCKSNEAKSTPFSKPKVEQTNTLSSGNKNFIESVRAIMPDTCDPMLRYKVTGCFDADNRTMYFDMEEAVEDRSRVVKAE